MKKGAQLDISFGMIFSIILIIAFVAFAGYMIVKLVIPAGCVTTGLFKTDLQENIDRAWNSEQTSFPLRLSLSTKVQSVCFVNLTKPFKGGFRNEYDSFERYMYKGLNMFFYPTKSACSDQLGFAVKHIDLEKITSKSNPYCIMNNRGNLTIKIEGYYGKLVMLS